MRIINETDMTTNESFNIIMVISNPAFEITNICIFLKMTSWFLIVIKMLLIQNIDSWQGYREEDAIL